MKLSLVVPCYNEAENVLPFQQAVISAFSGCGYDYEIIFVNDGSKDATLHNLKKLFRAQDCPVKVVSLSRNFGKESAIYAGLEQCDGEYISLIDADLQQRPEIVRFPPYGRYDAMMEDFCRVVRGEKETDYPP